MNIPMDLKENGYDTVTIDPIAFMQADRPVLNCRGSGSIGCTKDNPRLSWGNQIALADSKETKRIPR